MKTRYYLFILLFSITANAQELVINNTVYGQVTSTFYKEARVVRRITPAQFHELSVLYDGYRLNFKNDVDYSACFSSYPKTIDWELTEEELRNLRNFIRRNGGDLPKTLKSKVSSLNPDTPNTPNELVSIAVDQKAEEELVDTKEEHLSSVEINAATDTEDVQIVENDSTTWTKLSDDLDSSELNVVAHAITMNNSDVEASGIINTENDSSVKEMDQMRAYKRKGVIYRTDTLSVKEAKLIAMNQNFTAYRHFAAAQRIRGWNVFLGICTLPAPPGVIITGPVIAVRESIRKKKIEQAVEAYNISVLKAKNRDIKTLIR
ncbi:MAG: hypothetical protein L7S65_05010 [Schleiferiaceae bacterium]|nr:hypothetical protein [Schleiferiaceae bacterium]